MKRPQLYPRFLLAFVFILFWNYSSGQIIYHDFIPNITITSYEPGGNSFNFDVNQDGENDLMLTGTSWFTQIHQGCCWNHKVELVNLSNVEIGIHDPDNPYNDVCNSAYQPVNSIIDTSFIWTSTFSILFVDGPDYGYCGIFLTPYFYPFRVRIDEISYQYGWLRMSEANYPNHVTLYDMAINLDTNEYLYTPAIVTDVSLNKEMAEFIIYPNPTNGDLNICFNDELAYSEGTSIKIYNIHGKLVENYFSELKAQQIQLNLKHFSKGIYFCKIRSGSNSFTEKIIIE